MIYTLININYLNVKITDAWRPAVIRFYNDCSLVVVFPKANIQEEGQGTAIKQDYIRRTTP